VVAVLLAMFLICFGVYVLSDYGRENLGRIGVVALYIVMLALSFWFWYAVIKHFGIFVLVVSVCIVIGLVWWLLYRLIWWFLYG
jgi:hypothetical protein